MIFVACSKVARADRIDKRQAISALEINHGICQERSDTCGSIEKLMNSVTDYDYQIRSCRTVTRDLSRKIRAFDAKSISEQIQEAQESHSTATSPIAPILDTPSR